MIFPPQYNSIALNLTSPIIASNEPDNIRFFQICSALEMVQILALNDVLREKIGSKVYDGPFKEMTLTPAAMTGLFAPHLLGTYEWELHDVIERIIAHPYKQILDIGCSYGYYVNGLALRMPKVRVAGFDIDPEARKKCAEMAEANHISDRVSVSGEFPGEDFARYEKDGDTFVFMDIEGAEKELLDPQRYPALQKMDVLVEMHDCVDPQISKMIQERFAKTHDIEVIRNKSKAFPLDTLFGPEQFIHHMDHMLVTNEGRGGAYALGLHAITCKK